MPTALSINELFTPTPSGVVPANPGSVPADDTWLGTELDVGATLGLQTTTWQPGDPTRTIMAILAVLMAQRDGLTSLFIQAGFLDYAATGVVTFESAPGTVITVPVTPDPSNASQNPTGAPGWLDVLANEVYDVQREPATFAAGQLYLVNEGVSTNTYAAGTFHVANTESNTTPPPTYSNTSLISLPPTANTSITGCTVVSTLVTLSVASSSGIVIGQIVFIDGTGNSSLDKTWQTVSGVSTGVVQFVSGTASGTASTGKLYVPTSFPFQADLVGPGSNAIVGSLTQLVTTQLGVFSYNAQSLIGNNWETNTALAARCRLKLSSLSPSGPSGAYQYFALTSFQILQDSPILVPGGGGTVQVTLINGAITNVLVQTDQTTGIVTVTIANAVGLTDGATNVLISNVSATSPIEVTTLGAHHGSTGDFCYIQGVEGITGVDGYWQITEIDGTHFTLNGSSGSGSYVTGGTVEMGDLGMVDLIINQNVTPDCLSEQTFWATNHSVTVGATVYVPVNQVQSYLLAVAPVLATYFGSLPIGGVTGVESNNIVPIDAIIGLLFSAGITATGPSYVKSITGVTLNGSPTDLSIGATEKPQLSGGITGIAVVGV